MQGEGNSKHTFGLVDGVSQGKFLTILLLEMMHMKCLYNQALGWLFSEYGSQTCCICLTWELVRNAQHTLIYTDLPGNHFALIYFLVFKSTCIVIEVKFVRSDWTNRKSGCGQSGKPTAGFLLRLPSQRKSNMELMFMLRTGEGSLMRRCITATHFKPLVLPSSPFGVEAYYLFHTLGKDLF